MRKEFRKPLIVLVAGLMLSMSVQAEILLRCQITAGGETQWHEFAMTSDPYAVPALDLNRHFRFKAVVIGHGQQIDYVKIYGYYRTRRQPVLMHRVHYPVPVVPRSSAPDALTGTHTLYSPHLGRELQYGCTLVEGDK